LQPNSFIVGPDWIIVGEEDAVELLKKYKNIYAFFCTKYFDGEEVGCKMLLYLPLPPPPYP